ncbi:type II secretion system minor pseudopilin GspK [Achromobacter pestifer]|uniref:Type II secretion system protein K n=1 Tax=Achromobacter pestifer TaxID=1353889 RepID=A0A6S6Z2K8_9BURK|nr:type II secretion system minor pseudopilin GspK [Achromobacter pestifer]CAB3646986.1 Type II secretion system protein K [Achromobacter pestifer]
MSEIKGQPAGLYRRHRTQTSDAQQGMAVVAVLLVVAVIAVLASALLGRQTTAIRGVQTEQTHAQARWLLRGEISRAQVVLRSEAIREPATRLDGLWSRPVNGLVLGEVEGGPARAFTEIIDEQSKFNLRNLVNYGRIDPAESAAFLRLCALVGVPPDQAGRIARRVAVSLVEADRQSPPPTASTEAKAAQEAAQELGLAGMPARELAPRLRTVEDLLAVSGVDATSVARLRPYVTVLPRRTWINANTARAEVLAAWVPGLSLDRAGAMLRARDNGQWFINRGDFVNRLQMPGVNPSSIRIGITSQWFRVSTALQTPRTTILMQALLHDDKEALPQVMWLREGA